MNMTSIIGRGHSGTRAMSHTLTASGVFMGEPLNASGDLLPPDDMYEACRVMARHVRHRGGTDWDFTALHTMPIDPAFTRLVESYLSSVLTSDVPHRGWKLPETTLVYPWIVRMFPNIHYIYWIRDPRDCILGKHVTDDMARFGIAHNPTDDVQMLRTISWRYQVEIVKATPRPRHFLTVRFEDFVLQQDATLRRLQEFLGIPLAAIPVRTESVGRWRRTQDAPSFDLFQDDLIEHGYDAPPAQEEEISA